MLDAQNQFLREISHTTRFVERIIYFQRDNRYIPLQSGRLSDFPTSSTDDTVESYVINLPFNTRHLMLLVIK